MSFGTDEELLLHDAECYDNQKLLLRLEITRRRQYMHPFFNLFTQTHTAWRPLLYLHSVPGKRKVAVAGRLSAPDQYRSAFTCLCARLFSAVILSFAELCSFVVHLLWCVGSIYLKSSLSPPPPSTPKTSVRNRRIFFVRSSSACCLQQFLLSNIIHQAHLQAGRTDLTKASARRRRIFRPALHVRLGMMHINTHPSVTNLLQLLQATGGLPVSASESWLTVTTTKQSLY